MSRCSRCEKRSELCECCWCSGWTVERQHDGKVVTFEPCHLYHGFPPSFPGRDRVIDEDRSTLRATLTIGYGSPSFTVVVPGVPELTVQQTTPDIVEVRDDE